jgi:hypothetical protein
MSFGYKDKWITHLDQHFHSTHTGNRLTTRTHQQPTLINLNPSQSTNMSTPSNRAAWLKAANTPLEVGPAPMPTAGPGEIIVKNAAIAINPIDWHQQDAGIFVQQFPAIIGCDVAGEVHEIGSGVERFKKGDRVIG